MNLEKTEELMQFAKRAAVKAGEFLKSNQNLTVDSSVGKDIKLATDKNSEKIIFEILKPSGIPILSEEYGILKADDDELMWIVDPLDGTANYRKGMRELTCVSVALWKNGKPLLGVINRYENGELFSGTVGMGAWLNDIPIHTSDVADVKSAMLATGFPVGRSYDSESLKGFISQIQRFKKIRMLGTAALMGVSVACGRMDAYMEDQIMLWDIAASAVIVKAAGGYTNITLQDNNKCICCLFANEQLYNNWKEEKKDAQVISV